VNSINRPRGRPRKSSVSFRVFFRVLLYESVYRLTTWPYRARASYVSRAVFWSWRSDVVRRFGERLIAREPERRVAP